MASSSGLGHRDIEASFQTGDRLALPQCTPNRPLRQPPQEGSQFYDCSGPLFSLYSKLSKEEDKKETDRWKQEATDGVLVFSGLFSAVVSTFLSQSTQGLGRSPEQTSAFYLANIYQILDNPNFTVSPTSIPFTLAKPPPFSPPTWVVWVNSLWCLSLVISLSTALGALLLRQWAHRYIELTQPSRCSPERRVRMRKFLDSGMRKLFVPGLVEDLQFYLHCSVFLFFIGLIIVMFHANHSLYKSVVWFIGILFSWYGFLTLAPVFLVNSPYFTPFSPMGLLLCHSVLYCLRTAFSLIAGSRRSFYLERSRYYLSQISPRTSEVAEQDIPRPPSNIILDILNWTMATLGEDDSQEEFFAAIPGFFNSPVVEDFPGDLLDDFRSNFVVSLCRFLCRNLLSNSISEEVKARRLTISMNATMAICVPRDIHEFFCQISCLHFDQAPPSIRIARILARWCTSSDGDISQGAQQAVSCILPYVEQRDDEWVMLAKRQYGLPEHVLRDNIARGNNSVLLVIFLHLTRQVIRTGDLSKLETLWLLSKFDIRDTVPDEFCALWNEIVHKARHGPRSHHLDVLIWIRHLYIAIHQSTDAAPTAFDASTANDNLILANPFSYPLCNIAGHHPNPAAPPSPLPDDPDDALPHTSHPGTTAPRHAEEAIIVSGLTSSTSYAPPLSQELPSTFPTAHPLLIPSGLSLDPTIPSSIQTAAIHPDEFVSMVVSHLSRQSSLSTADVTAKVPRPDGPMPALSINEPGETYQTPAATLLAFPPPDPLPLTSTSSSLPHLPSVSAQQPADIPDTSPTTLGPTFPRHLDSNMQQGVAAPSAASDILFTVNQIPQSIPNVGATQQTSERSTDIPRTIIIISGSQTSTIMIPAVHGSVIPAVPFPTEDLAVVQPDRVLHPLGPLSSSHTTASSHVTPQVTPVQVLDSGFTRSSDAPGTHDNTLDLARSMPREASSYENQSGPSTSDIAVQTLPPEDHEHD